MKARVWCFGFGLLLCGQAVWGADRVKLELVGECKTDGVPAEILVAGNHAYVVDADANLEVIDISDPARMVTLSQTPLKSCTTSIPGGKSTGWSRFTLYTPKNHFGRPCRHIARGTELGASVR